MKSTGVDEVNVVLAGVGGQGVVVASDALGLAAMRAGLNVRIANVHGLAQREGSVYSHVRIGSAVYSPKIPPGRANAVVGFEISEAARHLHLLKPDDGILIVNNSLMYPLAHFTGHVRYPRREDLLEVLESRLEPDRIYVIDAASLAIRAGNPRTVNVVMLGALSATGILPIGPDELVEAVKARVPKFALEENERAFWTGYNEVLGGETT